MNQIAWDLGVSNHSVLYLSLEMDVPALQERLFCYVMQISNVHLLHGSYSKDATVRVAWRTFEEKLTTCSMEYCDFMGKRWQEIDQFISRLTCKPDVVILDHINEIMSPSVKDRRQIVDDYIINFRTMAVKHGFAGIIGAQINRSGQGDSNKEPLLHQLKESGKLEETADLALLLYWPYKDNEKRDMSQFKVIIAKNRNGWTGKVDLKYEPQFYRFSDQDQNISRRPAEQTSNTAWGD